VKVLLLLALCVCSACSVAEIPGDANDVDARDSRSETSTDSSDGAVDAPGEVAPEVLVDVDVREPDAAPETVADATRDGASADEDGAAEAKIDGELVADVAAEDLGDGDFADTLDSAADAVDEASSDVSDTAVGDTSESNDSNGPVDVAGPGDTPSPDASDVTSACNTVVSAFIPDPSPHVMTCSEVTYPTNPPTSGPHYPIWAAFKTYMNPVNPGFLVHSMEHGAVVIHYRCTAATPCDAELAALATFLAARPADPLCLEPTHARIIVTPSVTIDTRFAVSAWGASLRSDCFDLDALGAFLDLNYAKGPENFCSDGVDLDTIEVGSALYCPPPEP